MKKSNTIQELGAEQAILQNSLKEISDYKYALDESSIVAITDQKGIIQYANDNFCRISKYCREELIGQDHRIVNSGFHSKDFIRQLWLTIANGKIWKGELKNKAKDGTIYWVDTTIVPFLDENHKPYQYVAIRSDITERKKLEEQQAIFSSIVNSSDDAIFSKNLDGMIMTWNKGAEKIFGYGPQEIINKNISILIPAHLQNEESEIISKIRNGIAIEHYETQRIRKDGKLIDVSLTISPIKDSFGNITGASKISRDISERKEYERQQQNNLKEIADYKYALDESSIVAITDQKGIIKYANDNFCKISKYSREELIGQDHRIINSSHHPKEFIRDLWVTISNGKIWKGELKNKAKDGTIYWVDTTIVPFLNEAGKPYQYVAIRADITDRKKVEEEIIVLNRGLEQKITERTAQLEAVNKELEAFTYSVSHDLRAPLRAVNGYAQMLEEDYIKLLDDEGRRLLNIIKANAAKMGSLIDELLEFSRLGRKEIRKVFIDMNELVKNVLEEMFQNSVLNADIQVKKLHLIMGDHVLMHHVLINLLSNAIKYSSTNPSPVIQISSEKKDGEIIFSISDNGVGFDMQYVHKLFGVFQRLHNADEFPGTGVGLAIVQRIVNKHGGSVWAKGELNKGAVFYFSIPITSKN